MNTRPYSVSVRPVIRLPIMPDNISTKPPTHVEITTASGGLAIAIRAQLQSAGIAAQCVASPTGQADCTILTEGYASASITTRHWDALTAACHARGTRILMPQPATPNSLQQASGLSGLARTLRLEWPETIVQSITLDCAAPTDIAQAVLQALSISTSDDLTLSGNTLFTSQLGDEIRPPSTQQPIHATWLITGGGRGVTATCAIELAQRSQGIFLLAGRSALIEWPTGIPRTHILMELRGHLARHNSDKRPVELNRIANSLLASQEVQCTLSAIRATGATAEYIPLDVSNAQATARTIKAAQAQYGQITGLIHGAGVLSDRLAETKALKDVQTVFAPKVEGLLNLLPHLDILTLSHIGLFSSAAAIFGNAGQSDYAMANDILNQIAQRLSADNPHLHIKSFAWGPWDGGMVDASLAALFKERGISLIPTPEGAHIFADQMLSPDKHPVQLCIGDDWAA